MGTVVALRLPFLFCAREAFIAAGSVDTREETWPTRLRPRRRCARLLAALRLTRTVARVCAASFARSKKLWPPATRQQLKARSRQLSPSLCALPAKASCIATRLPARFHAL